MPALLGHSHHILHNSRRKKSCDSTRLSRQSSAGLRNPKPQTSPLQPALPILKRLEWQHEGGVQVSAVTPPARWVSFLASRVWSALLVLTAGGFSLHCSHSGLPAQNRFTHLHDCHCPLSVILGSHNVFTVLLIFPGPGSGGVPECITSPALCGVSAPSSLSQSPFFPPSCVCVTPLLSAVPLRPLC